MFLLVGVCSILAALIFALLQQVQAMSCCIESQQRNMGLASLSCLQRGRGMKEDTLKPHPHHQS